MDAELGAWLRRQREDRGWNKHEMARHLIQAAGQAGDKAMPDISGMTHNIHRWEREGGVSERHKLHYCRLLTIHPSQFGAHQNEEPLGTQAPGDAAVAVTGALPTALVPTQGQPVAPGVVDPHPQMPGLVTYRGRERPVSGHFAVEQEVMMAAHESSDHAAEHEQHGIGEATLEQLRADMVRLSKLTDTGMPLSAFLDMRRVRDRIYRLLDRQLRPREQEDLYFLLGCLNGLMGLNANRLGYPDAAEELIRAGWAYANTIDHNPLRGMLRAKLAYVMYWRSRFREARDLAVDGLRYAAQGPLGATLHLEHARAAARIGDPEAARQAVGLAHAAREDDYRDDLVELGGEEFALSLPTTYSMAGAALIDIRDGDRDAAAELEQAISLYDAAPGEAHWFGGKALAGTDLALTRLRSGALDGAIAALEPLLVLPPAQRVSSLTTRLTRVQDELAAPLFRSSPRARNLEDQIEEFSREAVTAGLHSLSG
jgi:hypothetical protein